MAWRLIQLAIPLLSNEYRSPIMEFKKFALGEEDIEERWRECIQIASNKAQESINQLYVNNFFEDQETEDVKKIVGNVINTYLETILDVNWIGDSLKSEIAENLKNISVNVGVKCHGKICKQGYKFESKLKLNEGNFFDQVMGLSIINADIQYRNLLDENFDMTQYSTTSLDLLYFKRENSLCKKPLK